MTLRTNIFIRITKDEEMVVLSHPSFDKEDTLRCAVRFISAMTGWRSIIKTVIGYHKTIEILKRSFPKLDAYTLDHQHWNDLLMRATDIRYFLEQFNTVDGIIYIKIGKTIECGALSPDYKSILIDDYFSDLDDKVPETYNCIKYLCRVARVDPIEDLKEARDLLLLNKLG